MKNYKNTLEGSNDRKMQEKKEMERRWKLKKGLAKLHREANEIPTVKEVVSQSRTTKPNPFEKSTKKIQARTDEKDKKYAV